MRFERGVIPGCIVAAVLLCFLFDTHECFCLRTRPRRFLQEIFCYSDFVFEFIPIRSEIVRVGRSYRPRCHINTTKVYKTSPEYESVSEKDMIYTDVHGVYFPEGIKYTILGNVWEGKIYTDSCGHSGMISGLLTPYQILQLESGYSQNCNKCQHNIEDVIRQSFKKLTNKT